MEDRNLMEKRVGELCVKPVIFNILLQETT